MDHSASFVLVMMSFTCLLPSDFSKKETQLGTTHLATTEVQPSPGSSPSRNESVSHECPLWSYPYHQNSSCTCPDIPNSILLCDKNGNIVSIERNYCVTYDQDHQTLEVGYCIYNYHYSASSHYQYYVLPSNKSEWNEVLCAPYNRKGTLCGECKEGYYAPAYSYDLTCVKCGGIISNVWKFAAAAFLPLTVFYIIIVALKINIFTTYLYGYSIYCQATTTIQLSRFYAMFAKSSPLWLKYYIYALGTFYSIWNLDFFRYFYSSICFKMDPLEIFSLDLIIAAYPTLLTVAGYGLISIYNRLDGLILNNWKHLCCLRAFALPTKRIKSSLLGSFSTFLFLLHRKCLATCGDYLLPVVVYKIKTSGDITYEQALYYYSTIQYYGKSHLPFAVLGILVFVTLGILPTLFTLIYPFKHFQIILNLVLPLSWQIRLRAFMDTVQGCYKDGTEPGTYDLRWFSASTLVVQLLLQIAFSFVQTSLFRGISAECILLLIIFSIIMDPFKRRFESVYDSFLIFVSFLACNYVAGVILTSYYNVDYSYGLLLIISMLPALYFIFLTSVKLFSLTRS